MVCNLYIMGAHHKVMFSKLLSQIIACLVSLICDIQNQGEQITIKEA